MLMTATGSALAASFTSNLEVTGSVELSTSIGNSTFSDGNVSQTGEVRKKVGGATTSNGFSTTLGVADGTDDGTTTSPAPSLTGTLTDIGDGIGWGTDLDAGFATGFNFNPGYDFIVDFLFNLKNTSLTDTLTVTMKANISNVADAGGADASADSKLDLERNGVNVPNGASEVLSDTAFGDALNGASTGTFGEEISDIRMLFFDVMLAPGGTATVGGNHEWEGGVFENPGNSNLDISLDITIENVACSGECIVAPVPVPGAVWLFGSGLSGLAFLGLRRRREQRRTA